MAGDITITINPDLETLARKFGKTDIRGFIGNKIKELSFLVERESKKVTPVDTGRLRASIGVSLRPFSATIRPRTNYAVFVHEGTKYMRARPFMLWGAEAATKGFEQRLAKELETHIQVKIK